MPSHVAHLLFAEDTVRRCRAAGVLAGSLDPPHHAYLVLGAQGPDIFYHNQRRRPTGIAYGSLMHRRGYGRVVSSMWHWALNRRYGSSSWAAAWVVGFATHAILDRHTHPFINAHSGWPEPGNPASEAYRSMHPFLERLIDVELLNHRRSMHPRELGFAAMVDCGDQPPAELMELLEYALTSTYRRAASDRRLPERIANAYRDAIGFYRFTDYVDERYLAGALEREERGEIGRRWLSIVHPPEVPADLDVLNLGGRRWPHPCPDGTTSSDSFLDCYEAALDQACTVVDTITDAWETGTEAAGLEIELAVANWNLSDGRASERPCAKHRATPLPLQELQDRIRESIRGGGAGRLQ